MLVKVLGDIMTNKDEHDSTRNNSLLVKKLRDRTNCTLMQCRNALVEAEWDIDMAFMVLLRKFGPKPLL